MFRVSAFLFSVSLPALVALTAQASPLPTLSVEKLIELCSDPSSPSTMKSDAASELTFRDNIKLDEDQLSVALSCLQTEFGTAFTYNGFALFSPDFDTAAADANRLERESEEQLLETRADAFSQELARVCFAELEKDRFRAMTTNACAQIFIRDGFPE